MKKNNSNSGKNNIIDINNYKRDYYNPYSRSRNTNTNTNKNTNTNTYLNDKQYDKLSTTKKIKEEGIKEQNKPRRKLTKKQRIKLKKRRRKRLIQLCIITLVGSIILVWGIIKLNQIFSYNKIAQQTVQLGVIDNSLSLNGLIVRNEKVYLSNNKGTLYYIADEGEKVSKDGDICVVADEIETERIKQETYQIDSNIYTKQGKREDLSYYQDDLYELDKEIVAIAQDYYTDIENNTVQHVITARQKLDNIIEKRTNLYTIEKADVIKEDKGKKSVLFNQMSNIKSIEKAEVTGTVSYIIDGSENKLSIDKVDKLNYSDYKSLYNDISNSNYLLAESIIEKDMPIYKLILKDEWQIITYIEKEKAHLFKENDQFSLNFYENGDLHLNFRLKKKVQEENEKVKLVFETNESLTEFLNMRKINFKIGSKYEGIKIPLQAIVERTLIKVPSDYLIRQSDDYGVMRKRNDKTEWVKVSVQYEKDNHTYILQEIGNNNSIVLNDEIYNMQNQKIVKLDSIETHKGVYAINGKVAEFKSIKLITQNDEYAIVEPGTTNNGLKALDKIITNPKNVKEDDLLRYMKIQNK